MDGQPIRTFLDSGVLIAAYKGSPSIEASAINILDDPDRIFLSSPFVRHDVSPKALYNRQQDEYRFYQKYFRQAAFCDDLKSILRPVYSDRFFRKTLLHVFKEFAAPHGPAPFRPCYSEIEKRLAPTAQAATVSLAGQQALQLRWY